MRFFKPRQSHELNFENHVTSNFLNWMVFADNPPAIFWRNRYKPDATKNYAIRVRKWNSCRDFAQNFLRFGPINSKIDCKACIVAAVPTIFLNH